MTRVTIAEYGAKRKKIRVFTEGELVRVTFRIRGKLKTQSWPNTAKGKAEAKAYAKGVDEARIPTTRPADLTIRALWDKFIAANDHLRPRSVKLYTEYYSRWTAMWGDDFLVEDSTLDMMNDFRVALKKQGLETSTTRQTIRQTKMVYRWGAQNKLIPPNEILLYKFKVSRDEKRESPAEYSADETAKFMAKLDPKSATQWRAWVALTICGNQGVRQNAALHLKWADVDEALGVITWRSEWDKMGREWSQPIRSATTAALQVAREWREKNKCTGPWVLPQGSSKSKSEVYTLGSLWQALKGAETRSGVTRLKRRGGHGLRRRVAGDVNAATGDPALALLAIGDTDLRQANTYLKKRDERVKGAFDRLDNPGKEPKE